jgi:hypothetical protein
MQRRGRAASHADFGFGTDRVQAPIVRSFPSRAKGATAASGGIRYGTAPQASLQPSLPHRVRATAPRSCAGRTRPVSHNSTWPSAGRWLSYRCPFRNDPTHHGLMPCLRAGPSRRPVDAGYGRVPVVAVRRLRVTDEHSGEQALGQEPAGDVRSWPSGPLYPGSGRDRTGSAGARIWAVESGPRRRNSRRRDVIESPGRAPVPAARPEAIHPGKEERR